MGSEREKLRVGVVGVGHLGHYHVQKYAALKDARLVGVFDVDRDKAEDMARRYGARAFPDLPALLNEVDALSLAVPTEHHYEEAMRVLDGGVHLLVEKPITYSVDHAARLVDTARGRGLVLQVGHVERFNPPVIEMTSILERPVFFEAHRMNIFTVRGTDVDVVLDLMIHDLDILLNAVRAPVSELHAVGMKVVTESTDIANARIIFENGTVANLTASRVSNKTLRKIRVFQPDAYISVNCARRDLSITRLDGRDVLGGESPGVTTRKLTYPDSDPLADQIASFVRAVREGSEPEVSGEDGKQALEVALHIMDQIGQGCKHFKGLC
ncbi:MAG: Gfo/Idh/MocA family oxidoreductase [Deltaproteobacteria bacterium]|nr:Gfo/Idh/MocA family oxidoreductase [Deltaproteobacteria bacterium]